MSMELLKLHGINVCYADTMQLKQIPSHPAYSVDDLGTVYGKSGKPLRLFAGTGGYLRFTTYVAGRWQQVSVHVKVCEAFYGPRPPGAHAAHRNGCVTDNRVVNLRWATAQENEADKVAHDRRAWGERHPRHKLTESEVHEIRASGELLRTLAARYSVAETTISHVRNRKTWRHI